MYNLLLQAVFTGCSINQMKLNDEENCVSVLLYLFKKDPIRTNIVDILFLRRVSETASSPHRIRSLMPE